MKAAVLVVFVLAVTARMHLTVTVLGAPLAIPVPAIEAAAVLLALAGTVWLLLRSMARNGWPRLVIL